MAIYNPESNQHSDGSDGENKAPRYYDVHCSFGDGEGYSIPVKMGALDEPSLEDIISYCIRYELFSDSDDSKYVDNITRISFDEYRSLKNY